MRKINKAFLLGAIVLFTASCANKKEEKNDSVISYTYNNTTNEATVTGFSLNQNLKSVVIPETVNFEDKTYKVTQIGEKAFAGTSSTSSILESVVLPDTITNIEEQAFARCINLRNIKLGNNIKTIKNFAFDKCQSLVNIELPDSVTSIGYGAFRNCTSLVEMYIPDGVSKLNGNTFYGDTSIKYLYAGKLDNIGSSDFYNCRALTNVYYSKEKFTSVVGTNNDYYDKAEKAYEVDLTRDSSTSDYYFVLNHVTKTCDISGVKDISQKDVVVPEKVRFMGTDFIVDGIYKYAFYHTNIETITLNENVTGCDAYAFAGSKLKKFDTLNLRALGSYALYECSDLEKITFGTNCTTLSSYVFAKCISLKDVILPEALLSLSAGLFAEDTALESVTLQNSVNIINADTFKGCTRLKTLYYTGSEESFKKITNNDAANLGNVEIVYNQTL